MNQTTTNASPETTQQERKAYTSPTLTDFGSFAEITQGFGPGAGVDNGLYS